MQETDPQEAVQGTFADGLEGRREESVLSNDAQSAAEARRTKNHPDIPITVGPSVSMTAAQAVGLAVTPRTAFANRTTPPLTVCNGRVFCDDELVFMGDIIVPECAERLSRVAKGFGITVEIYYEGGVDPVWSSETPHDWLAPIAPVGQTGGRITLSEAWHFGMNLLPPAPAPVPKSKGVVLQLTPGKKRRRRKKAAVAKKVRRGRPPKVRRGRPPKARLGRPPKAASRRRTKV